MPFDYLRANHRDLRLRQTVVSKSLEVQLLDLKTEMAAQFKTQEEQLQEKIAILQAKLPK